MGTPTCASEKFASDYPEAARILSPMRHFTQPKLACSCLFGWELMLAAYREKSGSTKPQGIASPWSGKLSYSDGSNSFRLR
jgi:hypothetical protein